MSVRSLLVALCLLALAPAAHAGQVFPPENSASCVPDSLLSWNGGDSNVTCINVKTIKDCRTDLGYTCSLLGTTAENILELRSASAASATSPWHIIFKNNLAQADGYRPWGIEASYAGDFRIGRPGDSSDATYPLRIEATGDVVIGDANLPNNLLYGGVRLCLRDLMGVLVLAQCP